MASKKKGPYKVTFDGKQLKITPPFPLEVRKRGVVFRFTAVPWVIRARKR